MTSYVLGLKWVCKYAGSVNHPQPDDYTLYCAQLMFICHARVFGKLFREIIIVVIIIIVLIIKKIVYFFIFVFYYKYHRSHYHHYNHHHYHLSSPSSSAAASLSSSSWLPKEQSLRRILCYYIEKIMKNIKNFGHPILSYIQVRI